MPLDRFASKRGRARIPLVDRLDYFLRSRASKVVVLALVANTMVAQLLYNSAGQLVLGNEFVVGYLLISAVCSTFAFALFEVSTIFQLHDLMALDASIKADIGAEKLIKRGYAVLAVSSLINFLSVLYFLALAWHSTGGHATSFPLDHLPEPWNWLYYSLHAAAYTAVLFLAGIFGERPKSGKEVILATQRALEQQALERWRMQKEAQIEQMVRDGSPLGAVAAALASPETAERIALMEAATSGSLSRLDAARLSMRRAGQDSSVLDGLLAPLPLAPLPVAGTASTAEVADELLIPFGTQPPLLAVALAPSTEHVRRRMTPEERKRLQQARVATLAHLGILPRMSHSSQADGNRAAVFDQDSIGCGSVGHLDDAASFARLVTRKSTAGRGPVKAAATKGSGTRSAAEGLAWTGKRAVLGSRRAWRCDDHQEYATPCA